MTKTASERRASLRFQYGTYSGWLGEYVDAAEFGDCLSGVPLEIVTVAQAQLVENGIAEFSMRTVAKRVGMSLAALQYHFPTKSDLSRAMINHKVQSYLLAFDQVLGKVSGEPGTALESSVEWLVLDSIQSSLTGSFEIPFWAMAAQDEFVRQVVYRYMEVYQSAVAHMVKALRPDFTAAEAKARAILIVAMIEGCVPTCGAHRNNDELKAMVASNARMFARAMAAQ